MEETSRGRPTACAGDRELLKWFSSLQPENLLLHRTAYETSDEEFREQPDT